jgi:ADP-ribose pyrophosphatase YjhB (NUDIX family)
MKYCNQCGSAVVFKLPPDDTHHRYVCTSCDTIHYQNPKIVTGCIPEWEGKVLLCRRAIEPRYGYWTLPAGFMELGETNYEAALRETAEEANARVDVIELYSVFNLQYADQVYMIFRSRLLDLDFSPGNESLDVKLFDESDIPWDKMAFTPIFHTLKFYFQDRHSGQYRLHTGDIIKRDGKYDFRDGL